MGPWIIYVKLHKDLLSNFKVIVLIKQADRQIDTGENLTSSRRYVIIMEISQTQLLCYDGNIVNNFDELYVSAREEEHREVLREILLDKTRRCRLTEVMLKRPRRRRAMTSQMSERSPTWRTKPRPRRTQTRVRASHRQRIKTNRLWSPQVRSRKTRWKRWNK